MDELKYLAGQVGVAFAKRAARMHFSSLFVKLALIAVGSIVAGISQFMTAPPLGVWHIAGVSGAAVAGLGAAFLAITEQDASRELKIAQEALERARQFEDVISNIENLYQEIDRAIELYTAMSLMRGVVEKIVEHPQTDLIKKLELIMDSARRSLLLAFGFRLEEHWTVCLYKAEKDCGNAVLRCVVQERSIKCDINDARSWPVGVGVAGAAFAKSSEIIVPDMAARELGSAFQLGTLQKEYDLTRGNLDLFRFQAQL